MKKSYSSCSGSVRSKNLWRMGSLFMGLLVSVFFLKKIWDKTAKCGLDVRHIAWYPIPPEKVAGKAFKNLIVTETGPPAEKKYKVLYDPPRVIRKQIKLQGNKYTVGFFGGITGLKLTLFNTSSHFVNQAEIEICYLTSSGSLAEVKSFQVKAIKPHSTQVLCVPPNSKGVIATYRIVNIYSRPPHILVERWL